MKTYELVIAGHASGRTRRGWQAARADAVLTAARLDQAISVWKITLRSQQRELRATVLPDGSIVVERPLHRMPTGL